MMETRGLLASRLSDFREESWLGFRQLAARTVSTRIVIRRSTPFVHSGSCRTPPMKRWIRGLDPSGRRENRAPVVRILEPSPVIPPRLFWDG
ncbi:hypothetical protein VTK73DRAFT_4519 [Phialemonium thermophilum]|uniref:Uncharacterized protein n=1 Tax=Phialemonium thermophilum TaxID=223376 RepID=A0ABR3V846_9PEZI